jgi:hypothetical protein
MRRTPVTSDCLASVGYDGKGRELEIEFTNGGIYRYFDVSRKVYQELLHAESQGSYFNGEIKGVYRYRIVQTPKA